MASFRTARVAQITTARQGLQRLVLDDGSSAYALTQVIGELVLGDEVVINTTAVELGLGTGGDHVVHLNLSRPARSDPGPGHVMKARYLSEQIDAGSWEEHASSSQLQSNSGLSLPSLAGMRVLLCILHSHVAAVAAGVRHLGGRTPGYVMTDQAALPLAVSDALYELARRQLIAVSVSAGQAFGGDFEAVNVASGVEAIQQQGINTVIVAGGPGHVGTGTSLGFSALDLAGHAAVLTALGADVALAVRASSADERARHKEISHHTVTLLDIITSPISVPVPLGPQKDSTGAHSWITARGHRPVAFPFVDLGAAFSVAGLEVATMGRRLADDRLAMVYLGAAAAWLAG